MPVIRLMNFRSHIHLMNRSPFEQLRAIEPMLVVHAAYGQVARFDPTIYGSFGYIKQAGDVFDIQVHEQVLQCRSDALRGQIVSLLVRRTRNVKGNAGETAFAFAKIPFDKKTNASSYAPVFADIYINAGVIGRHVNAELRQ